MSTQRTHPFFRAAEAALPVMLGYVAIGIPCGILEAGIGLSVVQVGLLSVTFYSGAGQFMLPGLYMAGQSIASTIASISFVNTRQLLYSASFAPYFRGESHLKTFLFAATVTDESFGVNLSKFASDDTWTPVEATFVNLCCMASWAVSNMLGVCVGSLLALPTIITSFAMTSIFICLLVTQPQSRTGAVVTVCSMVGVVIFKLVGLVGPAILLGAIFGIVCGLIFEGARS